MPIINTPNNNSTSITGSVRLISRGRSSLYNERDINLIPSFPLPENFGEKNDYIEYHVYRNDGTTLISSNYNYNSYKSPSDIPTTPGVNNFPNTTGEIQTDNIGIVSTLTTTGSLYTALSIDPFADLTNIGGFSSGEYIVTYNFFQNKLSNNIDKALFIKEISSDRTEVRLASVTLTDGEIETQTQELIDKISISTHYVDYLLNFGANKKYLAINVALNKSIEGYEILFKLYEPLPLNIQLKDTLWVVEEKSISYSFNVSLDIVQPDPITYSLRGPNFNLPVNTSQGTISTTYESYNSLVSSLQNLQSSSYNRILNLFNTQSIDINVDYTNFSEFSFFGSVYKRIVNFYNKVTRIENNNVLINNYTPNVSSTSSLQSVVNQLVLDNNTIISQFDGYESYLYFESSSYTWPKSGNNKPYSLLSTGSAIVVSWYNNILTSASLYDSNNNNNLEYAIPEFLRDGNTNLPFLTFLNMIGHYFDNIWIYLDSITDLYKANNNLEIGISKDIVYKQLLSLGVHLYNSQAGDSVNQYLIGSNTGSSNWDGDTTITGSYLNNIPRKDLVSEIYKRLYHNLPLLLKSKGTVAGLEYLITTFGIPSRTYITGSTVSSSILNVKEYGGSLKSDLLKGYNNDKVRIIPNSIVSNTVYSGSILSPFHSLQTFPTSSNDFRENDDHYIDISFSPQSQIDSYISGAIASNNPTWSLDDYIGDPNQQYLTTYPDLDAQRKLYFETGVTGFAPFTASLLDYNGFIRLVEYFDNSLFKMLEDFVPERASLSTGITFNSPVLERNKVTYANPTNSTTESIHTAEYSASTITPIYGNYYNALSLSNNTQAWYTGEISGSIVDINQYFEDNYNPYLYDWNVWNAQHPPTQSINLNTFLHSDYNVLLNNVSQNVTSKYRNKIEYIWGTTGSIISNVELQDSYLSLKSYNTSRYEGSKTLGLKYNEYTGNQIAYYLSSKISASLVDFFSDYDWSIPFSPNSGRYSTIRLNTATGLWGTDVTNFFFSQLQYGDTFVVTKISSTNLIGNNDNKVFTFNKAQMGGGSVIHVAVSENLLLPGNIPTITSSTIINAPTNFQKVFYWKGDKSYGKTTAIDRNSYKLGWIQSIPSTHLNFYNKTPINLKYLVDSQNQVTDLNSYNNNLFEVQNIFKSGTPTILSITNKNQNKRDGERTIWKGGYSYSPIIYRENGEVLNFRYDNYIATQSLAAGFVATDLNQMTWRNTAVPNIGTQQPPTVPGYTYLNGVGIPSGQTLPNGQLAAADKSFTTDWPYRGSAYPKLRNDYVYNGNAPAGSSFGAYFNNPSTTPSDGTVYRFNIFNFNNFSIPHNIPLIGNVNGYFNEPISSSFQNNIFRISRNSQYRVDGYIEVDMKVYDDDAGASIWKIIPLIEKTNPQTGQSHDDALAADQWGPVISNNPIIPNIIHQTFGAASYDSFSNEMIIDGNNYDANHIQFKFSFPSTQYSLNEGEYLRISFYLIDLGSLLTRWNVDKGIVFSKNCWWSVRDSVYPITTYIYDAAYTSSAAPFTLGTTYQSNDTLNFSSSFNTYFYSSSFVGNNLTSTNYSEIIDNFSIEKRDLIKFGRFQDPGIYYEVISSDYFPGKVVLNTSVITGSNNPPYYANFAILRPKPDETSIILEGRNTTGIQNISQSLLIPYDASTTLKDNIGNIIKSINPVI